MKVNNEVERVRKESVVVYFEVIFSEYLLGGADENH
jgi:hypothetical protein